MNLYAYARNNPVMYVDLMGTDGKGVLKQLEDGALMWDIITNPTGWNIAWQIWAGFTPAGVAGDIRDLGVAISSCPNQTITQCVSSVCAQSIGFVPWAGDIMKAGIVVGGKNILKKEVTYLEKSEDMLWVNGAKIDSLTTKKLENGGRIDVENPAPGTRPGQVHMQIKWDKNKYYYNPATQQFHIGRSNGPLASGSIQKMLNEEKVQSGIKKGLYFLNGGK